jgi:hypothetical protein
MGHPNDGYRPIGTYNFAKRLKTLKGLTPYEYICKIWTTQPERFTINPAQHNVGLNSYVVALSYHHPAFQAAEEMFCKNYTRCNNPVQLSDLDGKAHRRFSP